MAILTELQDPRVQDVTVTHVEVPVDLRSAKVHVSVMGDERKQQLSLHGLKSSAGFLQRRVAEKIEIRYTPRLEFVLDQGVKKSIQIAELLQEVERELKESDAKKQNTAEPDSDSPSAAIEDQSADLN